jgi:dinuclear metal center YbgI/SA1388 family protein
VNGYVLSFLREWYSTPSKRFETRTTIERIEVTTINDVCGFLDSFAPTRLAEDWDNVGLLAGDPAGEAVRIMTCLTVTPESAVEAINAKTDLIVSHHPLPFRPLKRLTTSTTPSRLLWELIRAGVSIYSPHTGFDSALEGINQTLGQRIGLQEITPLVPIVDDPDGLGAGRIGTLANSLSLDEFVSGVKKSFSLDGIQVVGELNRSVEKIAVACGSGGSFLEQARRSHCDTFVTGEATFHTCLEARANNISLVLLGHFASERFAVEALADRLAQKFDGVEVWASSEESDPLIWV